MKKRGDVMSIVRLVIVIVFVIFVLYLFARILCKVMPNFPCHT